MKLTSRSVRRQSGARRIAARPESCEARTLLSATDVLVVDAGPVDNIELEVEPKDDAPTDGPWECLSPEAYESFMAVCDIRPLDEVGGPVSEEPMLEEGPNGPIDPSEFIRFMTFGGPAEVGFWGQDEGEMVIDEFLPIDDSAPVGWHPEWAYRTLISPDAEAPEGWVDEQPVEGEFVELEPVDFDTVVDGEWIDVTTLEGWDPSWAYRNFTPGDGGEEVYYLADFEAPEGGGGWEGGFGQEVEFSEGEFVEGESVASGEVVDGELTPEQAEWIRMFYSSMVDFLAGSSEGELIEFPSDPTSEVWTFGGDVGEVTIEEGSSEGAIDPVDGEVVYFKSDDTEPEVVFDGAPDSGLEGEVEPGFEYLAYMSMGMPGGAEVQRTVDAPESTVSDSSVTLPVRPIASAPASLFRGVQNSSSSSPLTSSPDRSVAAPAVARTAAPSTTRSRSTSIGRTSARSTTDFESELTPLFDDADTNEEPTNERPVVEEAPVAEEPEVSDANRTATDAVVETNNAKSRRAERPVARAAARTHAVTIDQFMSQFAQDSFIA